MITYKLNKSILCFLILFTLTGCNTFEKSQNAATSNNVNEISEIVEDVEIKMYEDIMVNFEEIPIVEIEKTLEASTETQYYFYFGRTTCLYCRKFVIEYSKLLKKVDNFFYIDTENFSESESSIMKNYGIEHVPAILSATSNDNMELIDIEEFINVITE